MHHQTLSWCNIHKCPHCRVLASAAVPGDLKRGISTAMLRLLAHSSGLIDTHPSSHSMHTPAGDPAESVTPRSRSEWPISPALRAAVAKIALGHQRPLEPVHGSQQHKSEGLGNPSHFPANQENTHASPSTSKQPRSFSTDLKNLPSSPSCLHMQHRVPSTRR